MQAVIITCYKDKENLIRLIKSFDDKVNIYIHIDKKSKDITLDDIYDLHYKNVYAVKKYRIVWGGYNHLLAILDLLKKANLDNNDYFHIISGQDYLIKELSSFNEYFKNNKNIYMTFTEKKDFTSNIVSRYKKGFINSNLNYKNRFVKGINKIYTIFRNRNGIGEINNICKGMIWASFPKDVNQYILEFTSKNKFFMRDLKHCLIPEEFFLQSIIANSNFKENIINNNLRFTDWNFKNGSYPAYLDESYYDELKASECFFARKIDSIISKKLIELIDKNKKKKGDII